ncbi:MAG: hypothetical protein RBT34_08655 [Anaerolineaceae bacterium]|jgi:hypothetical protein|nr:hypothetical protein [Anaerolineaceae bacterium]
MPEKKKRAYPLETNALSGMKLTRAGRLAPKEHRAFLEMMERSGLDEHQQKDMLDRLIDRLKGI